MFFHIKICNFKKYLLTSVSLQISDLEQNLRRYIFRKQMDQQLLFATYFGKLDRFATTGKTKVTKRIVKKNHCENFPSDSARSSYFIAE